MQGAWTQYLLYGGLRTILCSGRWSVMFCQEDGCFVLVFFFFNCQLLITAVIIIIIVNISRNPQAWFCNQPW